MTASGVYQLRISGLVLLLPQGHQIAHNPPSYSFWHFYCWHTDPNLSAKYFKAGYTPNVGGDCSLAMQ